MTALAAPLYAQVTERLYVRFPSIAHELVELTVETVDRTFAQATIQDFLPILVEREAASRLAQLPH